MGQQLVALLGCGIERHRVIHLVISRIGHLLVAAIYRTTRSINEVLYAPLTTIITMSASFQDVVEANEVALNVGIRIGNGVAHARLGCEVYDHLKVILGKEPVNEC